MGGVGDDAELWRVYDEMGQAYLDHAEDGAYNAHYDRPCVLELCADVHGLRVLDACCGPGLYAAELRDRGATVVGFDASTAMVALAQERLGGATEVVEARLGDRLPFPDGAFDLVVCALAIHYVKDKVPSLKELHRVLRPGGALVLSTQHPTIDWLRKGGSYFDVVEEVDTWRLGVDVRFWREPLTVLCDAIHRAGFLIERLVEPEPSELIRERWPDDYEDLRRAPGFLAMRLIKP
jgi:SAM-dependent methyltransferase